MRVALFYFSIFMYGGVIVPYFPLYYRSLQFTGTQIAVLCSLAPLFSIVAPPLWGYWTDRSKRASRVVQVASLGAFLCFLPLFATRSFLGVAAVMAAYAVFSSSLPSLTDAMAIVEAKRVGTDFSRLRLWGSLGFVLISFAFGTYLGHGGQASHAVPLGALLVGLGLLSSLLLRPVCVPTSHGREQTSVRELLASPRLIIFLVVSAIHWAAAAPYHMLFAVHLRDVGVGTQYAGIGIGAAVIAEVFVMWHFRWVRERAALTPLLVVCFAVGALRWLLTAMLHSGVALAAIQVLHGVSFAAWFIASIAYLEEVVPDNLRATGRSIYASVVLGIGGGIGNLLAGSLYDRSAGSSAFVAAAGLEIAAIAVCLVGMREPAAVYSEQRVAAMSRL